MPYTPPGHTPIPSAPQTPQMIKASTNAATRPPSYSAPPRPGVVPRSSSYLSKHRRAPSFQNAVQSAETNSLVKNISTQDFANANEPNVGGKSVRQSPSPSQGAAVMPPGAVTTPPESSQNSSDEETSLQKRRGRVLENLEELQKAIRGIEQRREGSPTETTVPADLLNALEHAKEVERSLTSEINMKNNGPLTAPERRAIEKSSAETTILLDLARKSDSIETSDGDEGAETPSFTTRMVRKKSGELVKPALRASSHRRRPLSMPGTPTYGKAVHFDSHLEQVKHFSHVDKPLAVSAGTSPVENYDSDTEFPWGVDHQLRGRQPAAWEILTPNFPKDSPERQLLPVRVEKLFVSGDNASITGYVAVQNLAFHKHVAVRFTLDHWRTTSEVLAEYSHDPSKINAGHDIDRFSFNIRFADQTNIENKVMFFCVRYNVNGQEFWDNNSNMNFQIEFRKKKKQAAKAPAATAQPRTQLNSLPRGRQHSGSRTRPKSMPISFDDFANGIGKMGETFTGGSTADIIGESHGAVKLKDPKKPAGPAVLSDVPGQKQSAATQAFANRYDFGASLTAAIQAAKDTLGDKSGFDDQDGIPRTKPATEGPKATAQAVPSSSVPTQPGSQPRKSEPTFALSTENAKPESSGGPTLHSSSYNDLISKYCFFGSTKASSPLPQPPLPARSALRPAAPINGSTKEAPAKEAPAIKTAKEGTMTPVSSHKKEYSGFNFIPLAEAVSSPPPTVEAQDGMFEPFEPYQAQQGGFSFSGTHTPTAIFT